MPHPNPRMERGKDHSRASFIHKDANPILVNTVTSQRLILLIPSLGSRVLTCECCGGHKVRWNAIGLCLHMEASKGHTCHSPCIHDTKEVLSWYLLQKLIISFNSKPVGMETMEGATCGVGFQLGTLNLLHRDVTSWEHTNETWRTLPCSAYCNPRDCLGEKSKVPNPPSFGETLCRSAYLLGSWVLWVGSTT